MRNEKDKALSYIEKALQLGPRQVLAHTLRGDVLLALGKPEHAIVSFFKAKEFRRDLRSYRGIVDAYLAARKVKEALVTAKEANACLLNSAAAVTLLGKVLASPQTQAADKEHAKVRASFLRALLLCVLLNLHDLNAPHARLPSHYQIKKINV